MTLVPFESELWHATSTLSGAAMDLIPLLRHLQAADDWTLPEVAQHWVELSRELVEGEDVSPAVELVLPWVLELSATRNSKEVVLPWLLIGEVELGLLMGGGSDRLQKELVAAAGIARSSIDGGASVGERELAQAIAILPEVPVWGRVLVLRLVLIGHRYTTCSHCEEILDVEWNGSWKLGGNPVTNGLSGGPEVPVLKLISQYGADCRSPGLMAALSLCGVVRCSSCGTVQRAVDLLAAPLSVL